MTPAESDTRPAEGAVRPPLPPHDLGAELHAISAVLWRDLCAHELTAADFWCRPNAFTAGRTRRCRP